MKKILLALSILLASFAVNAGQGHIFLLDRAVFYSSEGHVFDSAKGQITFKSDARANMIDDRFYIVGQLCTDHFCETLFEAWKILEVHDDYVVALLGNDYPAQAQHIDIYNHDPLQLVFHTSRGVYTYRFKKAVAANIDAGYWKKQYLHRDRVTGENILVGINNNH